MFKSILTAPHTRHASRRIPAPTARGLPYSWCPFLQSDRRCLGMSSGLRCLTGRLRLDHDSEPRRLDPPGVWESALFRFPWRPDFRLLCAVTPAGPGAPPRPRGAGFARLSSAISVAGSGQISETGASRRPVKTRPRLSGPGSGGDVWLPRTRCLGAALIWGRRQNGRGSQRMRAGALISIRMPVQVDDKTRQRLTTDLVGRPLLLSRLADTAKRSCVVTPTRWRGAP